MTTTHAASEKQINFVKNLLRDRLIPEGFAEAMGDPDDLDGATAKWAIDTMLKFDHKPIPGAVEEPGMYEHDGTVYQVVRAKAGHLYAKHLTDDGWDYAVGAMKFLRATHRISPERAYELSELRGQCIRCLRTLTNAQSVKRSIGPVCINKL